MSFFPRSYFAPEASFTPLFRLLDDFDNYSREVSAQQPGAKNAHRAALPTFSPRFDVKETETGYELHGELPGVEKENVRIEFTEPQTIVISGRTERTYTSGTPPAGLLEGNNTMSDVITEGNENNSHKATVEDEEAEKAKEQQGSEVVKHNEQQQQQQQRQPKERIWVSERSVGEFSRTFSFPTPVDQEAVAANLKDGILSVTVPKARKPEGRRIAIN